MSARAASQEGAQPLHSRVAARQHALQRFGLPPATCSGALAGLCTPHQASAQQLRTGWTQSAWHAGASTALCARALADASTYGASDLQRSVLRRLKCHCKRMTWGQVPPQARGANRGGAVAPLRAAAARGRPRRVPPPALAAARRAAVAAQRRCSGVTARLQ